MLIITLAAQGKNSMEIVLPVHLDIFSTKELAQNVQLKTVEAVNLHRLMCVQVVWMAFI